MNKKIVLLGLAILVIVLIIRIVYINSFNNTILASYPLEKVEEKKELIKIYLSEGASLDEVVNLKIFKGISPTMDASTIVSLLGNPKDSIIKKDTKLYIYYTDEGRIETGASGDILANDTFYYSQICLFYKQDFLRNFVFNEATLKYLPKDIQNKQIGVFEGDTCNLVINLSDEEEDWIQWDHTPEY